MNDRSIDEETLRELAEEGNESAQKRLADIYESRGDVEALSELLDEGSEYAGLLLTKRAAANHDVHELQRLADAGSPDALEALEQILGE